MKLFSMISLATLLLASNAVWSAPGTQHQIFFEGSDYELNVYHVKGRQPGKTLLIIGGIQGDEPGAYLSADLYPDLMLKQGNLIVVPRANLKSVILGERGPDGDMNRQFHDEAEPGPMTEVVSKLKELMGQADLFLHLHDGWGFHSPTYINEQRNPQRYGQSLIVDTEQFQCDNGQALPLGELARTVLKQVNQGIDNQDHHLTFFNTRTADPDTPYTAMRKTATYYAMRQHCLPAFGVEASKNLPSTELKVLYHNLVINEFMQQLGIVPETPRILVSTPRIQFAELEVNGESRIVKPGDTLIVDKGANLKVRHISSDYQRGITCDVLDHGGLNDGKHELVIEKDTRLLFRKESAEIASIGIRVREASPQAGAVLTPAALPSGRVFLVSLNNTWKLLPAGATLPLGKNDSLRLISSFEAGGAYEEPKLNFKGWVSHPGDNSGDDRGHEIIPKRTEFLAKYSIDGKGSIYPVTAVNKDGEEIARILIKLTP